jgi:hypothetical protein
MPKVPEHHFRFTRPVLPEESSRDAYSELRVGFRCDRCKIERWYKYQRKEMVTAEGRSARFKRSGARADECDSARPPEIQADD